MSDFTAEINDLFATPNTTLQQDVLGELQSILRIHSLSPQELFFKWEAYSLKMGAENTQMDHKTARDFKKDLQDALERESRGKAHMQSASKRNITATPRNANTGDVFGVLDSIVGGTPGSKSSAMKRKNNFETPSGKTSKVNGRSSPGAQRTPNVEAAETTSISATSFADRANAGQIIEQLNGHIPLPEAPEERSTESRVKLKANTEIPKFAYKPMAMKLSEASEILDDRIDEFAELVKTHHGFPESAFGNPAAESTAEIIAVGRIASDTSEGKLNAASMVLETSRRMGAGLRVPLRMEKQPFDVFPGKIVALKGVNSSGEYFTVSEVLTLPRLPLPATSPLDLDIHNERVSGIGSDSRPLNILIGSGPYTTETELSYDALHTLCDRAAETVADVLILTGPFLDLEHPRVASGDFDLPADSKISGENATMPDVFRALVSTPLNRLVQQNPSITIILIPSVRDAISKHVSWPQDRFNRKELGLHKQVTCVTNPIMLSINEILVGISTEDVLYEMQRQRVSSNSRFGGDTMAALSANVIDQRHFFPVFPPLARQENGLGIGASLDIAYLKLGELLNVVPDLMVLPSALTPFVKVVEGVMVVNPGFGSKKRAAGTFAQVVVKAQEVDDEAREAGKSVVHELYNRARVDIVRI